jgi:hypothetical protein
MADNKASKAVGLLAILGLMFAKTCKTSEHDGSLFLKGCKTAEHERIKPSEVFPSENPHVNDVPPIIPSDVPPIPSAGNNETKSVHSEDEVFLKKMNENEFSYTDKTTSTFSSLGDVKIDNSKTLIVDGKLTEDEVKALSKQGVKFICDKNVYDQQKNITHYQVIFVFSEDREVLKDLYGVSDEQVNDLIKIAQPALTDISSTKVSSQSQLEFALADLKKDNITPVVVFNNKDKTLFGNPLSYYGVSNVITCNSYSLGGEIFFNSTDYLGIDHVIKSLVNINQPTLFDFYKNFSNNYATQLYNDKKYLVTVVAATAVVAGGGGGFIIYYNLNEKS